MGGSCQTKLGQFVHWVSKEVSNSVVYLRSTYFLEITAIVGDITSLSLADRDFGQRKLVALRTVKR